MLFRFALLLTMFFCLAGVSAKQKPAAARFSAAAESAAVAAESEAERLSLDWKRESQMRAAALYAEASNAWNEAGNFPKAAHCLRKLGQIKTIFGEKKEAEEHFKKALSIAEARNITAEKVKALSALALLASDGGRIRESDNYLRQALKDKDRSNDPAARATALTSAGELQLYRKKPELASEYFEKALAEWRAAGDVKGEAGALLLAGYALIEQENFHAGIEMMRRSLDKWRDAGDQRGEALAFNGLGLAHLLTNEKQKALDFYRRAEQIFPPDVDFFERAVLSNGIGSIYEDYGEWNISLDYRRRALELYELAGNIYGQLATLPSLAVLSNLTGDATAALAYLNQARELAAKLDAPYYQAIIAKELGNFYFERGEPEKASDNYRKALAHFEKDPFMREIALIRNKLGELHLLASDPEAARAEFEAALEIHRRVENRFGEAQTLFNLARLERAENNLEKALAYSRSSLELTESLSTDVLNSNLKRTYLSNVFERYDLHINTLMTLERAAPGNNYAAQALETAEKSRARSLLENLALTEADFIKDADPEMLRREKEIRARLTLKSDRLTDLLSGKAEQAEVENLSAEIRRLENELETIKAGLKRSSPVYSAVKDPPPFDLREFQTRALDENSLLLEFSLGASESYLWLVGKNDFAYFVLPPRREIEQKVESLRALLASRGMLAGESVEDYQTRMARADDLYHNEARLLSRDLFGPIAERIEGRRLIVVPDGKLHYFPISALPLPHADSDEPLLLKNETVYEPSAQTLLMLDQINRQTAESQQDLLIFADPVFTADDARLRGDGSTAETAESSSYETFRFAESLTSLKRLAASQKESRMVEEIVGSGRTRVLDGFSATRENALSGELSKYRIIHFATHGIVDENRPALSGIVLSAFDREGRPLEQIVRLHDIYGMNLNADLVVLSACSTGIGKEVKSEGLMSLNNAFLSVGARTVASSLWKVEDGAALELMKNFYEAMTREKLAPSKAMQTAQIKMRENARYRSPFYWAAFTVQGDYRNAPGLSDGGAGARWLSGRSVFRGAVYSTAKSNISGGASRPGILISIR
jgi:CHAT domain-containing protein